MMAELCSNSLQSQMYASVFLAVNMMKIMMGSKCFFKQLRLGTTNEIYNVASHLDEKNILTNSPSHNKK